MLSGADVRVEAIGDLHRRLLPLTLDNAWRTPFYRAWWSTMGVECADTKRLDLASLPVVAKADLLRAGRTAQVRDGLVCNEVFTSGTTGVPFITIRGNREQSFIAELFSRLFESNAETRLRGLRINNPYHGHHVQVPLPAHFHSIGIYDSGSFAHGLETLVRTHDDAGVEPHCSLLVGLERCLRALTIFAEEAGRPEPFHLNHVISYSQLLTTAWKARLEAVWSCPVTDRFSLAEVFGGASSCLRCGWWHFDPHVVAEVVGSVSRQPLAEGTGMLLLTPLYPFQEAQPLVRYWTGDLVDVSHATPCQRGLPAIRPLGRASAGIPDALCCGGEADNWLIAPRSLYEAVDPVPEMARLPRFRDADQVRDPIAIGHPKYRCSFNDTGSARRILVEVELRGELSAAVKQAALDVIERRLLDACVSLRIAIADRRVSLSVRQRTALEPQFLSHSE